MDALIASTGCRLPSINQVQLALFRKSEQIDLNFIPAFQHHQVADCSQLSFPYDIPHYCKEESKRERGWSERRPRRGWRCRRIGIKGQF